MDYKERLVLEWFKIANNKADITVENTRDVYKRQGKSKLMQAYIDYRKSNFENINIIFIDFMDLAYEEIMEYHALHLSLIHI